MSEATSPLARPVATGAPRRALPWLALLLVVLLAGAMGAIWLDARQALGRAEALRLTGDALMHSQRLARWAPAALAGQGEALAALRDSRDGMGRALEALRDETPEAAADALQKAGAAWTPLLAAANAVLARQAPAPDAAAEALRARRAEQGAARLADDAESLRLSLLSLREAVDAAHPRNLLPLAGALFLAAIGLAVAMERRALAQGRARAEDAERQRREAERLEREAQRANEQNQAAILRLMNELQQVADGDLTVQATVSEDITGAIADSVNYTVEELRDLVSRVNANAAQVHEAFARAQRVAAGLIVATRQQSAEVSGSGEAVIGMARRIGEVAQAAAESADVARHSVAVAERGEQAVQAAIHGMDGIRDNIQETSKRIKRLGESSQEIGEIVELITDITEQTNVLALNAAIQAASAGEAGRGFTTVAEEVQRLAERSAVATRQIASLVRAIQADTQDAVAAMERSTRGVVEGARLSDTAGRTLADIGRVSRQLADLIGGIAATAQAQAAQADDVGRAMQRVLQLSEQTAQGTQQTAGSIRQLSALAQDLKASVARFRVGG